jgi:hypothetical protein
MMMVALLRCVFNSKEITHIQLLLLFNLQQVEEYPQNRCDVLWRVYGGKLKPTPLIGFLSMQ